MRWRTTIILIAVFLLGTAAGVGIARGYPIWRAHWHKPAPPPHHDRQAFIQKMKQRLNLSDAQTRQFSSILDQADGQYHQLHHSCHQRFLELHHFYRNQVRAMLNPQQLQTFNAWLASIERARAARRAAGH